MYGNTLPYDLPEPTHKPMSDKSLYALGADYQLFQAELEELFEASEGETTEEIESFIDRWLANHEADEEEKLDAYLLVMNAKKRYFEGIDAEIKRLQALAAPERNAWEKMKERVHEYLRLRDIKKVKTAHGSFSRCGNGGKLPLEVEADYLSEPERIPEAFRKVSIGLDTDAVREALEAGEELPFARFAPRGEHLRVK